MENKIPTVDEFVKSRFQNSDRADFESNKRNVIEFAKFHVEAQRKAIKNKVRVYNNSDIDLVDSVIKYVKVDKTSIDNAYDLNNIK